MSVLKYMNVDALLLILAALVVVTVLPLFDSLELYPASRPLRLLSYSFSHVISRDQPWFPFVCCLRCLLLLTLLVRNKWLSSRQQVKCSRATVANSQEGQNENPQRCSGCQNGTPHACSRGQNGTPSMPARGCPPSARVKAAAAQVGGRNWTWGKKILMFQDGGKTI